MTNKVKFVIIYNPHILDEICYFMNKCDFKLDRIEQLQSHTVSWDTTTKVDRKYIAKMKKELKQFYEEIEKIGRVISIKKV